MKGENAVEKSKQTYFCHGRILKIVDKISIFSLGDDFQNLPNVKNNLLKHI